MFTRSDYSLLRRLAESLNELVKKCKSTGHLIGVFSYVENPVLFVPKNRNSDMSFWYEAF